MPPPNARVRENVTPRSLRALLACLVLTVNPALAQDAGSGRAIPSFAELEAANAVIGVIHVNNQNIFDLDDPKENVALFRLANRIHVRTRSSVIARQLLFRSGERVSAQLIDESERLLRSNKYLYDVSIRPLAYRDGVVDIEVTTRDTWTLEPGIRFSREGGENTSGLTLRDKNFLGTGVALGYARESDVDRSSSEFSISHPHALGGRTAIGYTHASLSDGASRRFSLDRPFYALDTRRAGGFSISNDDRIESVYSGGVVVAQYRARRDLTEAYWGWSEGLVDGWTRRTSIGLSHSEVDYAAEPRLTPPTNLPADEKLVSPFIRYEVLEDDTERRENRNLVGRTEYFALGFRSSLQLGRALSGLGSSRQLWSYSASIGNGFRIADDHDLLASASLSGRHGDGRSERQKLGFSLRYFVPNGKRSVFYASITGDVVHNPFPEDRLYLGGDSGLRAYPLRYQAGERRTLITVEQRVFTDWFPFRLFRVGGAVFYDIGRAWGGADQTAINDRWLHGFGFGLRILSARTANANVLHVDFAFPQNADPSVDAFQVLVKTRVSF